MPKIVVTGPAARDRAIKGANFLADCVKQTLGPWGLNAVLEKGNRITNDGVSIASEIELKDEVENRGMAIFREACLKTVNIVGDGTTSALVLAQAILGDAVKLLAKEGSLRGRKTAVDLLNTIEKERKEITQKLTEMATPISTVEQLVTSAKVSVEDDGLASLIGELQFKLGPNGVIIVEETQRSESAAEQVIGIRIDNGLAMPGIINNHEKRSLELHFGAKVILTNHVFHSLKDILPLFKTIQAQGISNVILVGRAFGAEAAKEISEHIKTGFTIVPVNAPYVDQGEVMKDLAAILGGRFIDVEETDIGSIMASDAGYAYKFIGRRGDAIFTGPIEEDTDYQKVSDRISKRVEELRDELKGEPSEFERRNLEGRLAQLENGFGILRVGGSSDVSRKYFKDKAEDAVNAVRIAFQEGVVPGAGLALKTISDTLPDTYILKRPICSIYEQIMSTAPEGFKVEEWVVDPLKVQRVILEKACSVAGTLATISTVIVTEKEKPRYMVESKTTAETPEEYL